MRRLFVAIWPPGEVVERLRRIAPPAEQGVRLVPPENWHVTLRFVGDADPTEVARRLEGVRLPTAEAHLGPSIHRLGDRHLVVGVAGVDDLADAVRGATAGLGESTPRPFVGHLTLARTGGGVRSPLEGMLFDAEFAVTEVALVESELAPDGARYTTLATFSLG